MARIYGIFVKRSNLKTLYDVFSAFAKACLPIAGIFNKKLYKGAKGRERTWDVLDQNIKHTLPKIWVHVASLGEYEQVVPILEKLNQQDFQVVLTFFSPSGYENKKNTPLADTVCYLPIDTPDNAIKFLDVVEPVLAIFVKYEFWPNYLNQLNERGVHTILVSGVFREKMIFHAWYGRWMLQSLDAFDHFFLQNESSLTVLEKLGFENATVNGDTRFDRASQLIERDNSHPVLEEFVSDKPCLVVGSSWPEDIAVIKDWIIANRESVRIIIAPHEVDLNSISRLRKDFPDAALWSDLSNGDKHTSSDTLIIDTIGMLTRAYSYAQVAYVGGGMGSKGLHNILEAATYGIPVVIGKNYDKFPEARKLEDLGGLFSISDSRGFMEIADKLFSDKDFCTKTGMISGHWINSNTGATASTLQYLKNINEDFICT